MIRRMTQRRHYMPEEEIANWVTHGLATLMALIAALYLSLLATREGDPWSIVGCSVFGFSMVLLYATSTTYHAVPENKPAAKHRWRRYDQAAIYLLIAGSYTPFVLANLRTWVGWSLLGFVWVVALFGIYGEVAEKLHSTNVRVAIYLAMGWSALLAGGPILEVMPVPGLMLIGLGGLAYTIGVIFFMWRQLPYHHAIWHLWVIGGTTFHYMAVVYYAVQVNPVA